MTDKLPTGDDILKSYGDVCKTCDEWLDGCGEGYPRYCSDQCKDTDAKTAQVTREEGEG